MSKLKDEEVFVAKALIKYFEKSNNKVISYTDGGDPPDILFEFENEEIGIEVRQLEQNDVNKSNTLDNKYENIVKNLNMEDFEIDSKLSIWLWIKRTSKEINIIKLSKKLMKKLNNFFENNQIKDGSKFEISIDNIDFIFTVFDKPTNYTDNKNFFNLGIISKSDSRDYGDVVNHLAKNVNMDFIKYSMINNAILDKQNKCKNKNCRWLALFDRYFSKFTNFSDNEHYEFYKDVIQDKKGFEKIFIVFENNDVMEL